MHGDFSRWQFDGRTNDQGILQQQGRVLLDNDVNHQTFFSVRWQQQAARDIIGRGIAAVPEEQPDSFQVTAASLDSEGARVTVRPGLVWANGNLVHNVLEREWLATRLGDVTDAGASGTRDAVVLETWLDAISGFQEERLLEPALGGPDTTERAHLVSALRLVRMSADEHCEAVAARLDGDPGGRLTVRLEPARTLGDPDCPVDDPGGYRGPEHHLYRIEMADVNEGAPRFKWSRFNGGLVGHGRFDATTDKVHITANQRPIATSGLTEVYVEALEKDEDLRRWRVVYGGKGTLANDHEIDLTEHLYGEDLPAGDRVFIRIWDGIEAVSAFPSTGAVLRDGIVVAFDEAGAPGDFWTFPVRAGWPNPETLVDAARPQGIQRSFVPLAVLGWGGSGAVSIETNTILDCRRPIAPLTRRDGCCTIRVGDGVASRGDVTSLQDAIDRLPPEGGTICLLPGEHAGAVVRGLKNITIHGCGRFSKIVPRAGAVVALQVLDSSQIRIHDLAIDAGIDAAGILVHGLARPGASRDIELQRLAVTAGRFSAIYVLDTTGVVIRDCDVMMADVAPAAGGLAWPGITVAVTDGCIERNRVRVLPTVAQFEMSNLMHGYGATATTTTAVHVGLGGIWLRGGSTRVRVIDNDVAGGIGHGVMLGHALASGSSPPADPSFPFIVWLGFPYGGDGPCAACLDGGSWIPLPGGTAPNGEVTPRLVPGDKLVEIEIRANRIRDMGMAGIGVVGFFADKDALGRRSAIEVEGLTIADNVIAGCLRRELQRIDDAALEEMGYGAIALARVADLLVAANRIEDNGVRAASPVCGVYVWEATRAIVRDNVISGTGVALTASSGDPGARGGIFVERATSGDTLGVPALVIHANRVTAPAGHALRAIVDGDAAITCNQLASLSIGPGGDALVGATVLLLHSSFGARRDLLARLADSLRPPVVRPAPAPPEPPDPVQPAPPPPPPPAGGRPPGGGLRVNPSAEAPGARVDALSLGRIAVTDNLIATHTIASREGAAAAITVAGGDVAFGDNQCLLRGPDGAWATHAYLRGRSLRVIGSRFAEPTSAVIVSGVIVARLTTVSLNQADHCLVARGNPLVITGNIEGGELDNPACQQLAKTLFHQLLEQPGDDQILMLL